MLFQYLVDAPKDEDTQRAYVQLLHLYDCKKRIKILPAILPTSEIDNFKEQEAIIIKTMKGTEFFRLLSPKKQKAMLSGQHLMYATSSEAAEQLGIERKIFEFIWNYLSQYTHIYSMQFHRMEANGRGTGLRNEFDEEGLALCLTWGAMLLRKSTELLVQQFPDTTKARNGRLSQFTPGPLVNSLVPRLRGMCSK